MEKSSVVAFRGWIRFCMEILYLGYGHPFASDFCRALQRYLGTEFLPIAMKNILLDTHGLWHEFCLLVLEVIACYNPLTSSWNHHSSSILDGCWCLNREPTPSMGKHGQTMACFSMLKALRFLTKHHFSLTIIFHHVSCLNHVKPPFFHHELPPGASTARREGRCAGRRGRWGRGAVWEGGWEGQDQEHDWSQIWNFRRF